MRKNFTPLIIFIAIAGLCAWPLLNEKDTRLLPSALIGKPVPAFDLGTVSDKDFGAEAVIVNFFASWCIPCAAEQKVLEKMAKREKLPIYGIAYKDKEGNVKEFLSKHGSPFTKIAHDETGRVAVDWGVYGVPETFVVSADGVILYRHTGAVTEEDYLKIIRPFLQGSDE